MTDKYTPTELSNALRSAMRAYGVAVPDTYTTKLMGEHIAGYIGLVVEPDKPKPGTWWIEPMTSKLYYRIEDRPDGQDAVCFTTEDKKPIASYKTPWHRLKKAIFAQVPEPPTPVVPF